MRLRFRRTIFWSRLFTRATQALDGRVLVTLCKLLFQRLKVQLAQVDPAVFVVQGSGDDVAPGRYRLVKHLVDGCCDPVDVSLALQGKDTATMTPIRAMSGPNSLAAVSGRMALYSRQATSPARA